MENIFGYVYYAYLVVFHFVFHNRKNLHFESVCLSE